MNEKSFLILSRLFAVISIVAVLGFAVTPLEAGTYSGGTGEPNDPYLISTVDDFLEMSSEPNDWSSHFLMISDINLASIVFDKAPIAPDIDEGSPYNGTMFSGVFDGGGCIIRNFTVNQPTSNFLGIFGQLENHARLLNIGIENANITGRFHIGGLVGYNSGGIIRNCYSTGVVNGTSYLGGLIGYNYYHARVTMCSSSATVNGTAYYAGGLIGKDEGGFTDFCYATGHISGTYVVGGLVGGGSSHTIIRSCYSTGQVMGSSKGGLICSGGKAISCFWDIETSGISTSGGGEDVQGRTTDEMQKPTTFINSGWDCFGESDNGTADWWTVTPGQYPKLTYRESIYSFEGQGTEVEPYLIYDTNDLGAVNRDVFAAYRLVNNINLMQINWSSSIIPEFYGIFDGNNHELSNIEINQPQGEQIGFIGYLGNRGDIKYLGINGIEINSAYDAGGIIGYSDGIVSDCFAINTLIILSDNYAGGLIGTSYGPVVNCYSSGVINAIGCSAGGLIGEQNYETVNNCYSSADVSSDWANVGGLIGLTESASISNCFSESKVSGINDYTDYVGGLIGYSGHSLLSSCWANSQTTGRYHVGGLVGCNSSIIENSYSNGQVSGDIDVGGLAGSFGWSSEGTLTSCYSSCLVDGNSYVGGLAGRTNGNTLTSCFWDIDSSGTTIAYVLRSDSYPYTYTPIYNTSGVAEGKITSEMQTESTFISAGWDFNTPIWTIREGVDYPRLWWEASTEPVDLLAELSKDIDTISLGRGIANSLLVKLGATLQLLEDDTTDNNVAAINSLQAFINAVESQRGKKILEEDAGYLITAAQQIINILSSE